MSKYLVQHGGTFTHIVYVGNYYDRTMAVYRELIDEMALDFDVPKDKIELLVVRKSRHSHGFVAVRHISCDVEMGLEKEGWTTTNPEDFESKFDIVLG